MYSKKCLIENFPDFPVLLIRSSKKTSDEYIRCLHVCVSLIKLLFYFRIKPFIKRKEF